MWQIIAALLTTLAIASPATAASGGVQWSPDTFRIFANKDVGAERWAITLNLTDESVTGNVFFTDGRPPAFIWCESTGHTHEPELAKLILKYRCFGSDPAQGGFALADWNLISDDVQLDAAFFAPTSETCDLQGALNGPNAQSATSFWDCDGTNGPFQFQAFGDGTGVSSAIGPFEFDIVANGCGFGKLSDGSFFNLMFSPSRNLLTIFQTTASVDRSILSECHRAAF